MFHLHIQLRKWKSNLESKIYHMSLYNIYTRILTYLLRGLTYPLTPHPTPYADVEHLQRSITCLPTWQSTCTCVPSHLYASVHDVVTPLSHPRSPRPSGIYIYIFIYLFIYVVYMFSPRNSCFPLVWPQLFSVKIIWSVKQCVDCRQVMAFLRRSSAWSKKVELTAALQCFS